MANSSTFTREVIPDASKDRLLRLAEGLAADMADSWRRGQAVHADALFEQHPELLESRDAAFRLICEEVCLAQESGSTLDLDDLFGRFPTWRAEIQRLLECHELLKTELANPPAPSADILADFQIVAELGQGAQGRVVLARQVSLCDRPVILKISSRKGQEHLSLARLQHTNISPLYWVHDEPEQNQRVLCMPFFGTVTLHEVLHVLSSKPAGARGEQDLLDVLEAARSRLSVPLPGQAPWRRFQGSDSYTRAVCWIGANLANALQYAHERNLCHFDVKPSNVLLAYDGQPLLLDFHLARGPIRPDGPRPPGIGGTPQYMSPEQRLLLTSLCEGRPIILPVDGRSDLYALGLILYQLLGGPVPVPKILPRLEYCNPAVSPGLADIIHKCLAEHPTARYQDAGALAADLCRHLDDEPLRGVHNRSWKERWRKWRRRRPNALRTMVVGSLAALALCVMVMLLITTRRHKIREHLENIEAELRAGKHDLAERRFDAALERLRPMLRLAESTPGAEQFIRSLGEQMKIAERGKTAAELHQFADGLRYRAADLQRPGSAAGLVHTCKQLWEKRKLILKAFGGASEAELQSVRTDLLDIAAILAYSRRAEASGADAAEAQKAAFETLTEAEGSFGPSPVLILEKLNCARALGLRQEAEAAARVLREQPPRTSWECYSVGRSYLEAGDLERAAALFEQAVAVDPKDFWANFYQGMCAYRRQQYPQAVSAFRAAVTLQPRNAVAYFNRGLAHVKVPDVGRALADYNRALQLAPDLGAAAFARGELHLQQKRFAQAVADLTYALAKNFDPELTYYNLALVYRGQGNRQGALASAQKALEANPRSKKARELEKQLTDGS